MLALAVMTAGTVLVAFVLTTLLHEPTSISALLVILMLAVALDLWWKRVRAPTACLDPGRSR
jgi:uncharacterized membrane protein YczE